MCIRDRLAPVSFRVGHPIFLDVAGAGDLSLIVVLTRRTEKAGDQLAVDSQARIAGGVGLGFDDLRVAIGLGVAPYGERAVDRVAAP